MAASDVSTMTRAAGAALEGARFLSMHPTPAFTALIPEAERLCAALREVILEREAGAPGGLANSNVGGWHSARDMTQWGGPALDEVLDHARAFADRLTVDRQGQPARVDWRVECWANVNRRGQANKLHTHPGCFWSGTYYVDDGGVAAASDLGGEFEFFDPRGVAPRLSDAEAAAKAPGGPADSPLVRPRSGMMVLFPSWMPHGVRAYRGASTRISIAFNLALGAPQA